MLWTANVTRAEGFSPRKVRWIPPRPPLHPRAWKKTEEVPGRSTPSPAASLGAQEWKGGSCLGSQQRAAWRLQSGREAARPAEGVPGAGPWFPAVQAQRGGGGASSARCGRGGAGLGPQLRSAALAIKKLRGQSRGDTSTRCPPRVRTLDRRPAGSRFVQSRESA